ncbi:MAG TPA: 4Fe-4S dicluster domain-containing protein, partial [Clostridia bacterium]|nr:4Fe-4S dicluster domain-containing protein [Clostridia bacterium]
MKSELMANFDLCTGCGICQLACSGRVAESYNPRSACLRVTMEREGLLHRPVVCKQCTNAYCEKICIFKAIFRDEKTGALIIKPEACT